MSSESFDPEKLLDYIKQANKTIHKKIKNNDVVLVIGNTGSGKSTLINYLIGHKIIFKRPENNTRLLADVSEDTKRTKEYAKIGHFVSKAETLFPEGFVDQDSNLIYCDCPGFLDTRGVEEKVAVNINLELAIKNAKSVRAIIVVIDQNSLYSARGNLFKTLYEILDQMITNLESVGSSIIFAITRCDDDYTFKMFYNYIKEIKDVTSKGQSFFKNIFKNQNDENMKNEERAVKIMSIIEDNQQNIVIGNLKTVECRRQVIEIVKQNKLIDKDLFHFESFDSNRVRFNEFLNIEMLNGITAFRAIVEYPDLISDCDRDIELYNSKIGYYVSEIQKLENAIKTNTNTYVNSEQEFRQRIDSINNQINSIENQIKKTSEEEKSCQENLKQLENNDTPVLIQSFKFFEKRTRIPIIGKFTKSNKVFEYLNPKTPILNIKKECENGEFKNEKLLKANGHYNVEYESERGEDGKAKVDIFIRKKDQMEERAKITDLKQNVLPRFQTNLNKLNNQKSSFLKDKVSIEETIKSVNDRSIINHEVIRKKINQFEFNIQSNEGLKQKIINDKNDLLRKTEKANEYLNNKLAYMKIAKFVVVSLGINTDISRLYLHYLERYKSKTLKQQMFHASNRKSFIFNKSLLKRDSMMFNESPISNEKAMLETQLADLENKIGQLERQKQNVIAQLKVIESIQKKDSNSRVDSASGAYAKF